MSFKCPLLTTNKKLAFVAFLLGFIAIFMHDPTRARIAKVDVNELALKVQDKSSNLSVEELAEWLISKKTGFMLIDIRSPKLYGEYYIPTAVNIQPESIIDLNIPKSQKIIIYSDDNLQSAQTWLLLKSKYYKAVYMLKGGISAWRDQILFPVIPDSIATEEQAKYRKLTEISKYFGGSPRVLTQGAQMVQSIPQQQAMPKPLPPAAAGKTSGNKPKREGC